MLVSTIKGEDLTIEIVDKLLFQGLEDTREKVDCIIVLGSAKAAMYRVPVAVEAYHTGRSNKIMLCGGKIRDFPDGKYSEAEHMRRSALQLKVAEEDIILENTSQNTVENLRFGLVELEKAVGLDNIHSILLVTTSYHIRRSFAIAKSIFPAHISIIPCRANDNNTTRENWMNTPVGIARTKGEAMRIVKYIENGIIPDFEI